MLEEISTPADVKSLTPSQLPLLAEEVRKTIIQTVSANGGHLASNLGCVELTIALLRVFCPPEDKVVWDVGHQAYTWKLLTGRRDRFPSLRQFGGLSGFPKPQESDCDAAVCGHAGVALSTALGMAVGRDLTGGGYQVVAVLGDGAMTNGIFFEALNNLEDAKSKLIVVLNDNEMSISKNVGALSRRLGRMLADVRYNRIKNAAEAAGHRLHMTFMRRFYHRLESLIKSFWLQNAFFEEFGLRYVGPIDGHDFDALENAFRSAREYKRSVLIHVATQKGRGYRPAEKSPQFWHGVGPFEIGCDRPPTKAIDYSAAMGTALCAVAAEDSRLAVISAAMRDGTGLTEFAKRFPDRFFDVGICEEHAVVFAAGLAAAGMRPVFAVYSTFLQRAVDCVMHDVCLNNLPVVFCVDRAGVVGSDGPTHHGVFDIPMLRCLPNLSIMQPRNDAEMAGMLRCAFGHGGPCVIRYPRGQVPAAADRQPFPPVLYGRAEAVMPAALDDSPQVWIWSLGDWVPLAIEVARRLRSAGYNAGVVNARFVKPVDRELLTEQAVRSVAIVTLENGVLSGGFGSAVRDVLTETVPSCQLFSFGWPDDFIPHGTVARLQEKYGLTAEKISSELLEALGSVG